MTIGTGFIMHAVFKTVWKSVLVGTLTVFIGTWLGSALAFILGRYVLRDLTNRLIKYFKIMRALNLVIEKEGLRFCLLMRLCPLVPFNAFNYVMGGTSISFRNYFLAGFGTIPICAVNVFVGTTIMSIKDVVDGNYDGGTASLVMLIVGCILTLFITVYVTIMVRKYLKRTAEAAQNHDKIEKD